MDARATLAQCSLFASLAPHALDQLATLCEAVHIRGGEFLFRLGKPAEHMYIVALGRMRAHLADGSIAGDILRLEPIGEIGLLSGEPHGADVYALRDSLLLRFRRSDLLDFIAAHPAAMLAIARTIVRRMRRNQRQTALETVRRGQSLAIVPAAPQVRVEALARALAEAMRSGHQRVELIDAAAVDEALGAGIAQTAIADSEAHRRLMAWLNEREGGDDYVVYTCRLDEGAWAERCLRQSDRVLFVADTQTQPQDNPLLATRRSLALRAPVSLLMLRHTAGNNGDVLGWRRQVGADCHFFLQKDDDIGHASIARQLTGRGLGLVLSGGGARGFAHIGLLRALEDLNIAVDVAGGTSMGAFISALVACGHDSREIQRIAIETFVSHNYLNDYVLPRVSLIRGRKFLGRLRDIFGDRRIEHLPMPYFCVSTNLTRARTQVHDSGPLATWVGTSMSVPGMAPPVVWNGELLVDGAVTNSLPTDVMQALGRGPIIASDVSTEGTLTAPGVDGPDPEALLRRDGNRTHLTLLDILAGGIALTSESGVRLRASRADLYLRMPVEGVALFDWKRLDEVVRKGYDFAMPRLQQFQRDSL